MSGIPSNEIQLEVTERVWRTGSPWFTPDAVAGEVVAVFVPESDPSGRSLMLVDLGTGDEPAQLLPVYFDGDVPVAAAQRVRLTLECSVHVDWLRAPGPTVPTIWRAVTVEIVRGAER